MDVLYLLTAAGFTLLPLVFFGMLFHYLTRAIGQTAWPESRKKKVRLSLLTGLILWAVVLTVLSFSGFTGNFENFPFNVMPVVAIPLITSLILIFSPASKTVILHLPLKALTQLQVFRVVVEILLWLLFIQHLLPKQMTFEGRNWDILVGITSLPAASFLLKRKGALISWNILGLLLLINIVTIAILSLPSPIRVFDEEPANTIVTLFPFIFLPGFLVPLAYILHLLSLRRLTIKV